MPASSASLSPHHRNEKALLTGVLSTSLSLIPTGYAAWISNSVVLRSDFLRCVVEFMAILLSWLIIRRMNRADRTQFQYGFGKLEQISGLAVATSLFFASAAVTFSAITRIIYPQAVENATFGLVLAVFSVIGNVSLWRYYSSLSGVIPNKGQPKSPLLISQARLFRAKTVASIVVLVSLLLSTLNISETLTLASDPIGSLCLAIFLFKSAMELMSSSMRDLVDCAIDEALQLTILRVLIKHDSQYDGLKQIRTRRSGIKLFVELFLEFDGELQFKSVSDRTQMIQAALFEALPETDITVISSARTS